MEEEKEETLTPTPNGPAACLLAYAEKNMNGSFDLSKFVKEHPAAAIARIRGELQDGRKIK